MNFLADESIDQPIVERLRREGWTVLFILEMQPGISDDEVLDEANTHQCLLLTGDKDFGELVYRLNRIHEGVVLLRLAGLPPELKADIVAGVFQDRSAEFPHAFTVVSPGIVRIRHPK